MDWVTCDRVDSRFARFLGKSFEMMEELQRLRTVKCEAMMKALGIDTDDPLRDESADADDGPLPKRARKELADEITGPRWQG
eukprot:727990-Pyramimonas_sp.AAC.1